MRGALMVCGTSSDAGKSFVVAGLCRLLARRGVRVAPFKAQNMANNAAVTSDGGEIGHAQWVQALAAGVEPEVAMNPVLLKPTSERSSQVVVLGKAIGVLSATEYQAEKARLLPVVLEALDGLRRRFEVVICEGAGSPAEINLLSGDIVNLRVASDAGLPAIVVGDIDRGGVFASLYGTVALLPPDLRRCVRGFLVNKLRGDPALLDGAAEDLERRCGVPCLGFVPMIPGVDLDAEDSLALERFGGDRDASGLDVAVVRLPLMANFGDLDPLRLEPGVSVRLVGTPAGLGRPHLIFLPGSKATRSDLAWFLDSGLAAAVRACGAPVVAVCAGLQMAGEAIADPEGIEGPPGEAAGLGWLAVTTRFGLEKVLDRPKGVCVEGPGTGERVSGYRIHHGRMTPHPAATPWLVSDDGAPVGWHDGRVHGTTLHGLFESDGLRGAVLRWAAQQAGVRGSEAWGRGSFSAARMARLDRVADALEAHVDLPRLFDLVEEGALVQPGWR